MPGPGREHDASPVTVDAVPGDATDTGPEGWLHRLTRPAVLFPTLILLSLGVLWAGTLNLIEVEKENARRSARISSQEVLETYEAQVVRVMREIDQTLKAVQYAYRIRGDAEDALSDLAGGDLLPPELIFTVTLTDARGDVLASTGRSVVRGLAAASALEPAGRGDTLVVSRPVATSQGAWSVHFSRSLTGPGGSFEGIAVVEVDADFFVSGYETSKLGERGVLALLGTDGFFRARRTGDRVTTGERVAYDSVVGGQTPEDTEASLETNGWDGVRRYTSSRELYGFPLAVVVGLSEEEALEPAEERADTYRVRAAALSVLLVLILGLLGRANWKLTRVRRRESEARVAHANRVEHLAYHDDLTGLPNRSFLGKLLEERVREARRYGGTFAVLFLDLDRFKQINDTLGHDAGDELLQEVAERLVEALRDSDTVARMGGDEFVVVLPRVDEEDDVVSVARSLLSILAQPVTLLGQEFRVTASIGIALYPRDGEDEQTLMKNADIAMYRAKEAGRNSFRFFSEEMGSASLERLSLEAGLRRAVEKEEFDLHYQARRSLESGRLTGTEALLRWSHPEFGMVEPLKFLPLAEETGLIVPIGSWVLETACRQNVAWQEEGLPRLKMAVNLSARQFFDGSLLDDVGSALEESGMDAGLLELEICERVLARDPRRTKPILKGLKELGVGITIDNFGTGYSALSVLRQLPLDTIKIDRQFFGDHVGNEESRGIADAILTMGRHLSSSVVAQGVETSEQVEFLREHACDQVQGFYFNRPVPADEFGEVLRSDSVALS